MQSKTVNASLGHRLVHVEDIAAVGYTLTYGEAYGSNHGTIVVRTAIVSFVARHSDWLRGSLSSQNPEYAP